MADFTRAIELDGSDADALINRSYLYCDNENFDAALDDLNKAFALRTDYDEVYAGFANYEDRLGHHDLALGYLDKAISLDDQNASTWKLRGKLKLNQGDFEAAIDDLSRSIGLDSSDDEAYTLRAHAYRATNEPAKAKLDEKLAKAAGKN